jgi:hypothetical protein
MASSQNLNTPGNYKLEQWTFQRNLDMATYVHSAYGRPYTSMHAGRGLVGGKIADTELSHNPKDIESDLFGIGSTNLVAAKAPVDPQLKTLPTLSIHDPVPMFMPRPLVVARGQREYMD